MRRNLGTPGRAGCEPVHILLDERRREELRQAGRLLAEHDERAVARRLRERHDLRGR